MTSRFHASKRMSALRLDLMEGEAIQVRLAQDHSQVLALLGRFEESEKNYQRLLTVMKEGGADAYMILQEELDFSEVNVSNEDERHIEES